MTEDLAEKMNGTPQSMLFGSRCEVLLCDLANHFVANYEETRKRRIECLSQNCQL